MRLLVDTDAFCKLGVAGLWPQTLKVLGMRASDCARLAALPHMLRRGRLPRFYGVDACTALVPVAEALEVVAQPSPFWIDPLLQVSAIDPGEAQLLAVAAEHGLMLLSGDKCALAVVRAVPAFPEALAGRLVLLEAVLLALFDEVGEEELRRALQPLTGRDKMTGACFSEGNMDPRQALRSYIDHAKRELQPLILWEPSGGEL